MHFNSVLEYSFSSQFPVFAALWCWNYCYLSNLESREPLDLQFLENWAKISEDHVPEAKRREVEAIPFSQLRSWEEPYGGSLVIGDGAFLDGSHVELVGYQWNTSLPLGKMWDAMQFELYKWVLGT